MNVLEITIPFLIAGIGTCFAGILLDHVQYWDVYVNVNETLMVLPALLGLKGNLQMTLASRFSTLSNLGHFNTRGGLLDLTCANLAMNQFLATVIATSASMLVSVIHYVTTDETFIWQNTCMLFATALITSSVTSFVLDILMILVVQVSARFGMNPDNVASPLAASLGDMTALGLNSIVANAFYESRGSSCFYWLAGIVVFFYILLLPIWFYSAAGNVYTKAVLLEASHWYPLFAAMFLSTLSGVILRSASSKSDDIALFQPVMCGVGGNLVAVQASRLSTLLHQNETPGILPEGERACMNPLHLFSSNKPGYSVTRLLMLIVIPGQIIFYLFCIYLNIKRSDPSFSFLALYLVGSEVHVIILLYLAHVLTFFLWRSSIDPDSSTIPYLTSIGDVIGACITTTICLVAVPKRYVAPQARHAKF